MKIIVFTPVKNCCILHGRVFIKIMSVNPFSGMPEETWFHKMINSRRVNIRNNRNINVGSMWIETRQMLYKFYKPFNTMLAQLLRDKDFDFGFS